MNAFTSCPARDARRIMKLDPNNNDAMSSVRHDFGHGSYRYNGTVGIDGCVYGIPFGPGRIVKYDPINNTTSFVGEKVKLCTTRGCAVGRDGCIYKIDIETNSSLHRLHVLKIDTTNNVQCFVGNGIDFNNSPWEDPILGIDVGLVNTYMGLNRTQE